MTYHDTPSIGYIHLLSPLRRIDDTFHDILKAGSMQSHHRNPNHVRVIQADHAQSLSSLLYH